MDNKEKKYDDLIKTDRINSIIENMPKGLNDLEKAYYCYIELGKIIGEDPEFFLNFGKIKRNLSKNRDLKESEKGYLGNCRSISRLYCAVLSDERVGVKANLTPGYPNKREHIDTIFEIDGKKYIANLVLDLFRIQTGQLPEMFGVNLALGRKNQYVLESIQKVYGKDIDSISEKEIKRLDTKLGYNFSLSKEKKIKLNDTKENIEKFKKEILKNKNISKEEEGMYLTDYILTHGDEFTDFQNNEIKPSELARYYEEILRYMIPLEERDRYKHKFACLNGDKYNIISIFEINTEENKKETENNKENIKGKTKGRNKENLKGNKVYYVLEPGKLTYERKGRCEMEKYIQMLKKQRIRNVSNKQNKGENDGGISL